MNKIRLKDIAKDLGIGNKELLQILRELGIQVKSQMGTLTDEEAAQVRNRVRQGASGRTQVIDTEVSPGVIVRRRKAAPTPPAAAASDASRDSEPAIPTPDEPNDAAPPVIVAAETEAEAAMDAEFAPQAEDFEAFAPVAEEAAPAAPVAPKKPAAQTGNARIVRPATPARIIERPEPEKAAAPAEPEAAPEVVAPVATAPEPQAGDAPAQPADAVPVAASGDAPVTAPVGAPVAEGGVTEATPAPAGESEEEKRRKKALPRPNTAGAQACFIFSPKGRPSQHGSIAPD